MSYLSDIEIAHRCQMKPITEIAEKVGNRKRTLSNGKDKAKIDLSIMKENNRPNGKLILVTAITPTPAGEGKTTTTIGLADGLSRIGKNVTVALREPSLGPVFGIKGISAAGGSALYTENRTERRLTQRHRNIFTYSAKPIGKTYCCGGFTLARRGGGYCRYKYKLTVRAVILFHNRKVYFRLIPAVLLNVFFFNSGFFGNFRYRLHLAAMGDFYI